MAVTQEQLGSEAFPERRHEPDAELVELFRFDLQGHELQDPASIRGAVTSVKEVDPISMAGFELPAGVRVCEATVRDPYVEADPEGYLLVKNYVARIEQVMFSRGYDLVAERYEANKPNDYNEFTRAWVRDEAVSGVKMWRDHVPTALALDYLTNPELGRPISNRLRHEAVLTPESAAQMRFVDDAVAIRDRGVVMQELAEGHIARAHKPGEKVTWLSLASGTAEPAIAAAQAVQAGQGAEIELTVADRDPKALNLVEKMAAQHGFEGAVIPVRMDILQPDLDVALARETEGTVQQYDVVENMGFEEYLPQSGDELGARKGRDLPQASEFTREAWKLVKPGGVLLSGNMVLDRPQTGYLFGIVDWQLINARSEESILRVYKQAGVLDDPQAQLDIIRVKDELTGVHIYDIIQVAKLLEDA